jgi:uncharacterized protein (DUF1501 family)
MKTSSTTSNKANSNHSEQSNTEQESHSPQRFIDRRGFLTTLGLTAVTLGAINPMSLVSNTILSSFLSNKTQPSKQRKKVLVCIFQRGAMDGLMAVQPYTDMAFLNSRVRLKMLMDDSSVDKQHQLIKLDDRFALHPSFASFTELFQQKQLAVIHGVGSPDSTRSHFDAQDYMENGTPGLKTPSGWLNRAVGTKNTKDNSPFKMVNFTPAQPLSGTGNAETLTINDLAHFALSNNGFASKSNSNQRGSTSTLSVSLEQLYTQTNQELLRTSGKDSFNAMSLISPDIIKNYKPEYNTTYPTSPLGNHLKQVAQLIKLDVGMEIAFVESNGWDTHVQQGTVNGQFARTARDFSRSISAFWNDIARYQDDVVVLTMTEFGRTVAENGTGGTDHGRASCMFLLGNGVDGGKVYGNVPELVKENLADGRDLPVTTDFRSLFYGVVSKHLKVSAKDIVFPNWKGSEMSLFRG